MKIANRKELQNIATDHSCEIDYSDFLKLYRIATKEKYNSLMIDTTQDSMKFKYRKNFFGLIQ